MPKKTKNTKAKDSKQKAEQKATAAKSPAGQIPEPALTLPKPERLIRAIAVTKEILDAAKAKAYKRVTGVSFYQLGHDAISERLAKEGYLNRAGEPKHPSQEAESAKA